MNPPSSERMPREENIRRFFLFLPSSYAWDHYENEEDEEGDTVGTCQSWSRRGGGNLGCLPRPQGSKKCCAGCIIGIPHIAIFLWYRGSWLYVCSQWHSLTLFRNIWIRKRNTAWEGTVFPKEFSTKAFPLKKKSRREKAGGHGGKRSEKQSACSNSVLLSGLPRKHVSLGRSTVVVAASGGGLPLLPAAGGGQDPHPMAQEGSRYA